MAKVFRVNIDLKGNQLLSALLSSPFLQTGTSDPTASGNPTGGYQFYVNTTSGNIKFYNGSSWVSSKATTINALTIGSMLSGTSFDGSSAVTIALPSTITAGSVGSSTQIPVITYDTYGRITATTTASISTSISLAGTSGTGTVSGGGTLTFANGGGVASSASGSTITLSVDSTVATLTGAQPLSNKTLTLSAGTATVSPVKFTPTSAVLLTTPTSGSMEVDSSGVLYWTPSSTRKTIALTDSSITGFTGQATLTQGGTNANLTAVNGGIVYSGASSLAISAAGTSGQVLTSAGAAAPTWSNQSALSVGSATNATNISITDDAATASAVYPTWVTANTGNVPQKTTSAKLTFTPSTGNLVSTTFNGLTLTAASTGFTIAGGTTSKTLTISNTLTLAGTDSSTLNIGSGGTLGSAAFTASSAYEPAITTLSIAKGGTNGSATPTAGAVSYGTGTAYAFTLAGTSGQVLTSAGASTPTWTTATNNNTASAIVQRDASGNFAANMITLNGIPTNATDAATKAYVDNVSTGVNIHDAVAYATTAALGTTGNLVGGTITTTYNNFAFVSSTTGTIGTVSGSGPYTATITNMSSTANFVAGQVLSATAGTGNFGAGTLTVVSVLSSSSISVSSTATFTAGTVTNIYAGGVGATLTIASSSNWTSITIDGQSLAVNDRVLIKNQAAGLQNGIYTVTQVGTTSNSTSFIFTRSVDNDMPGELSAGDLVYVLNGTSNINQQWVQTATGIVIGTTSIVWTQFSGASTTAAGAGLVQNGNAFDVGTASTSRIVVNADNIDLATVSQSNSTGTAGTQFVQSHTVDSYGRVTGTVTASVQDATTSAKGIASFDTNTFTVTSGAVVVKSAGISNTQLANSTISGVALGSNLFNLSAGSGLSISTTTYNGSAAATISLAGTPAQKYVGTLTGDGTTGSSGTPWTVTHNLGTQDVTAQVYQTSSTPDTQYSEIEVDIVRATSNTITVVFATAPSVGQNYKAVIIG
jgi:hypothetical protein